MSAHPFGRQPGQSKGVEPVPGWVRLAGLCAVVTILAIGAVVAGIDIGQLGRVG